MNKIIIFAIAIICSQLAIAADITYVGGGRSVCSGGGCDGFNASQRRLDQLESRYGNSGSAVYEAEPDSIEEQTRRYRNKLDNESLEDMVNESVARDGANSPYYNPKTGQAHDYTTRTVEDINRDALAKFRKLRKERELRVQRAREVSNNE